MRIHYTGRQVEITPRIKSQVEEKLNKVHKILGPNLDLEARVILSQERHLHSSEITLNLKNHSLVGLASTPDFYSSLQDAMQKLEKQVVKYKQRNRVLKRRSKASRVLTPQAVLDIGTGRPASRSVPLRGRRPPLDAETAAESPAPREPAAGPELTLRAAAQRRGRRRTSA